MAPNNADGRNDGEPPPSRPDRQELLAFVNDAATEATLREVLTDLGLTGFDLRRSNLAATIATLRKATSPRTLIVDVSGAAHAMEQLQQLRDIVEPSVRVLLIGDRPDAHFYRSVTQDFGALEYVYKPLQHEILARHFGPLLFLGKTVQADFGGRIIGVTGARGGVGASSIAANLAWYFGVEQDRRTMLFDGDETRGTCAMLLGDKSDPAHGPADPSPRTIEKRLDILGDAAVHRMAADRSHAEEAQLIEMMRRDYNFGIIDLPFTGQPVHRNLLMQCHHRVIVMDPTLASIRDTLRLLALRNGPSQPRRPVVVLNRVGRAGTLTRAQVESALKIHVDVVLPDVPKIVNSAIAAGRPAVEMRSRFRAGILALAREVALLHNQTGKRSALALGQRGLSLGGLRNWLKPSKQPVHDDAEDEVVSSAP